MTAYVESHGLNSDQVYVLAIASFLASRGVSKAAAIYKEVSSEPIKH